ncbi:MAG: leishmanolysin-related zinc metalloendopeptidase [Gemmatimonadota bacterium]
MKVMQRAGRRFGACILTAVAACSDPAEPPTPASITQTGGAPTTAVVGTTVAPGFTVLDSRGRAVGGATVTFEAGQGGAVQTASAQTDANGLATPGSWTLGTQAGAQTLTVRAGAASFTLTVQALAGSAATIQALAGNVASGQAGEPVEPTPGVVVGDQYGNPVAGVQVTFTPTAASGAVTGAAQITDAQGVARPGTWVLGPGSGNQTLTVDAAGRTVALTVEADAGAPETLAAAPGNLTSGTAGEAITPPPGVIVRDDYGNPVPGVQVTFAAVTGSGSITGATQVTSSSGIARPASWTLGPDTGMQTLSAQAGALDATLEVYAGDGSVRPPASIVPFGTLPENPVVATGINPRVVVLDAGGRPLTGVTVTFEPGQGGDVEFPEAVTSSGGVAVPGVWTLGTQAGSQTLTASAGEASYTFTVAAVAGPAASVAPLPGNIETGNAGEGVVPPPAVVVKDEFGNPVAGAVVTFQPALMSGTVSGEIQSTNSSGVARPDTWTLGPNGGEQRLLVAVNALGTTLIVTAFGPPLHIFAGDGTTCPVNTDACTFTVSVTTPTGVPVQDATVVWSAPGGATLNTLSNFRGRASAPNLIQNALGNYTQTATLQSTGDAVTFTYDLVQAGQYQIDVRFIGDATASQEAIFTAVKDRWEDVITGDLPSVNLNVDAGDCDINHPAVNQQVDDLLLYIEVVDIDGVGKTLGSAGPCYIRQNSRLPVMGIMKLDLADVANMESNGTLFDVVLHEMGHVLGFGTLWDQPEIDLLVGAGGDDPFFTGAYATPEFVLLGGTLINGVPVENSGGAGTRDGHWRDATFADELMTGFINNSGNSLSTITIGSLLDLGYEVNFSVADQYVVPGGQAGYRMALREGGFQLIEVPLPRPRVAR